MKRKRRKVSLEVLGLGGGAYTDRLRGGYQASGFRNTEQDRNEKKGCKCKYKQIQAHNERGGRVWWERRERRERICVKGKKEVEEEEDFGIC